MGAFFFNIFVFRHSAGVRLWRRRRAAREGALPPIQFRTDATRIAALPAVLTAPQGLLVQAAVHQLCAFTAVSVRAACLSALSCRSPRQCKF